MRQVSKFWAEVWDYEIKSLNNDLKSWNYKEKKIKIVRWTAEFVTNIKLLKSKVQIMRLKSIFWDLSWDSDIKHWNIDVKCQSYEIKSWIYDKSQIFEKSKANILR